jgi:hypothetical protein
MDRHRRFDADPDPDPNFHFDASYIRILPQVLQMCENLIFLPSVTELPVNNVLSFSSLSKVSQFSVF